MWGSLAPDSPSVEPRLACHPPGGHLVSCRQRFRLALFAMRRTSRATKANTVCFSPQKLGRCTFSTYHFCPQRIMAESRCISRICAGSIGRTSEAGRYRRGIEAPKALVGRVPHTFFNHHEESFSPLARPPPQEAPQKKGRRERLLRKPQWRCPL